MTAVVDVSYAADTLCYNCHSKLMIISSVPYPTYKAQKHDSLTYMNNLDYHIEVHL